MKAGEGHLLLEQIHEMSKDILNNLMSLDTRLAKLQESVRQGIEIDKDHLLAELTSMRTIIGALEKEDSEELEDEKILENMVKKLNELIEMTLG